MNVGTRTGIQSRPDRPPPSMLRAAPCCFGVSCYAAMLFTAVVGGTVARLRAPPRLQLCNLPSAILEGEEGRGEQEMRNVWRVRGEKKQAVGRSTYHD